MALVKAMATVGGLTALSRMAGFARDLVISHTLGAGPLADAFFVALKLPNFFRSVTAEGALSVSFVPLYTEKLVKETPEQSTTFINQAVSIMIAVLLPFSVIMMWAMPYVMVLLAPGFAPGSDTFNLAVELSRLSFPYLGLVSIAALLGAVLNAHHKFGPYAFAPVLFNLCLIASVVFTPLFESQGHAMAVAMSASGALQAIWVWLFVRRMGIKLKIVRPRLSPEIKQLFKLMGPGILVAGAFQINLFMNLMIGSFLEQGSISYLYYADRLYQLPFGVIGIAVGTALLPMFSRSIAAQNTAETNDLYNRSLEYMLVLAIPCAFGLLIAADPLIRTIYEHGAFTASDATGTTYVLMCYALGLPAYILSRIYNAVFYAHKDTWSPVKISLITTSLNIPLSIVLAMTFGAGGIALSTSIVGWVLIALLIRAVKHRGLDLTLDARFKTAARKLILCTGLFVGTLAIVRYGLQDAFTDALPVRIIALVALIAASSIVYFTAIFMTKTLSFDAFKRTFLRRKRI